MLLVHVLLNRVLLMCVPKKKGPFPFVTQTVFFSAAEGLNYAKAAFAKSPGKTVEL